VRVEIIFDEPITFTGADGQSTHAPMVAATVHGEATRLIVDTGSTDHILTKELADRVGLLAEPGEEGIDASGASVASWSLGEVPVRVGDTRHTLANVIAIAAPGPFEPRGIGGLLSPQHLVPDAWMRLDMAGDRFMALAGAEADVATWLTDQAPGYQLYRLARAEDDTTILVRGLIEPFDEVITLLDSGGKFSDVVASAVPGLSGDEIASSGRGVGGSESFGKVALDQVLRVGEARVPIPRLIVRDEAEGHGILVGMDLLRGTIVTVTADPALPVFWQVPAR
jgi:Aspartyl protease